MATKPLPEERLEHYRNILLQEKEQTQQIVDSIITTLEKGRKNESGDLSSYSVHQADLGADTYTLENEVYILEEEQKKLKQINAALGRIYDKTYGICEISGQYISEERLEAIPWALYCAEAKRIEEKKGRA